MFLAGHPEVAAVGELHNLSHQIDIGRPCACGSQPQDCARWQAVATAVRERTGVDMLQHPFAFRVSRERPRNLWQQALRNWNRSLYYLHFGSPRLRRLGLPRLAVGGRTLASNTRMVSEIVRELSGARILVDSSKDYVRMRERYDAAPAGKVKVIYLYRDGRGVTFSSVKHWRASVWHGAKEWAKTQRRIRRMLSGVRPEDRTEVRYEDLVTDPEGVLSRICAFLGLPFSKAMLSLNPPQHHTIAGNKIRLERRMTLRVDEAWRQHLSPLHLRIFGWLAGAENRRLGYGGR